MGNHTAERDEGFPEPLVTSPAPFDAATLVRAKPAIKIMITIPTVILFMTTSDRV
jgi:hypothetical protein